MLSWIRAQRIKANRPLKVDKHCLRFDIINRMISNMQEGHWVLKLKPITGASEENYNCSLAMHSWRAQNIKANQTMKGKASNIHTWELTDAITFDVFCFSNGQKCTCWVMKALLEETESFIESFVVLPWSKFLAIIATFLSDGSVKIVIWGLLDMASLIE
jgi:hypothetical protein